jgi:NAD(P)H-hydrate epimerase
MTAGLATTKEGTFALEGLAGLLDDLRARDAVGVGPGIGRVDETAEFVRRLVHDSPVPVVLDADGLNAFEGAATSLRSQTGQALVLTPHPGEFARLTGLTTPQISADPIGCAREFATEHQLWVVLKSFRTLMASPDGQILVCPRGNPGMATAGMGDTLTGILTSMVGRYAAAGKKGAEDITRALALGIFLHATAGDRAALVSGCESLVAGDVIEHLGVAFEEIRHGIAQGRID